ncbi:hypothetical protein AXK60_19265 [Tsukamurella pseudospumae]|uniref:Uncharacterized protein n=2 Tax=Tsukamurella pseudospumae TaxID=239498 RepID=A0A138A0F5_9ACTN|nr:hypothetical protein AXK60_19265 [Tsukamurella pseudospumae]
MAAVAEWLSTEPDVEASRTVMACPEVWEGRIDGHSFYFRERHGDWRIELDLAPNGTFAERVVGTEDGEFITEPVELESGEVIAEGVDSQLGDSAVEHLALIVRTVRDHLRSGGCQHPGAARFCPSCGARTEVH